jgi:SAM-dependent methyltransferase
MPDYLLRLWDLALTRDRQMSDERTREPQYQDGLELYRRQGAEALGPMMSQVWHDDPRRLTFVLARYKFVAKMLSGKSRVLEVGCADAFGTRVVQQEVGSVVAVDFDPVFVKDVRARMRERWTFECRVHDMLDGPIHPRFDAAYSLDVLEHIQATDERRFMANIAASLLDDGVLIIGSPSIQSQIYASPPSKAGHVNCKDAPGLKALMAEYFANVFVFSMNDEVVHTGFYPMAHYLFAVGAGTRRVLASDANDGGSKGRRGTR